MYYVVVRGSRGGWVGSFFGTTIDASHFPTADVCTNEIRVYPAETIKLITDATRTRPTTLANSIYEIEPHRRHTTVPDVVDILVIELRSIGRTNIVTVLIIKSTIYVLAFRPSKQNIRDRFTRNRRDLDPVQERTSKKPYLGIDFIASLRRRYNSKIICYD